jgi:hypothetical protein
LRAVGFTAAAKEVAKLKAKAKALRAALADPLQLQQRKPSAGFCFCKKKIVSFFLAFLI